MFEKAARMKLRFQSSKGTLTAEDLWDLNLNQLNVMAKQAKKVVNETEEEDYLKTAPKDQIPALKFDIIIHVLKTKQAEEAARADAQAAKEKKLKIMQIIERKQDQKLENMDIEELKKELVSI